MEMALRKENYIDATIDNIFNKKLSKHGNNSPSILSILQQVEEVNNGERKVEDIVTKGIDSDEILKQERDYNVEYNKELHKKYGFNIETLSDYDNDKEGVIRSLKRNRKIQEEFINNKVEPIYKDKRLEYNVLDKNEVKDYILNNNIDLETLKTNKAIRSNLYKIINNIIESQKIAFLKNVMSKNTMR